ncbi:MAG: hypothetical protein SFT92_09195 [Rickettsiales bacterium]|nr:hypothetical protein [Rickettsiales bacterium]
MATQVAPAKKQSPAPPVVKTGDKIDTHFIEQINERIRNYKPASSTHSIDTLDGRYKIELSERLLEFDTRFAQAFSVTDQLADQRSLYALVCSPGSMIRHDLIPKLKNIDHPHLLKLVSSGTVTLSQPSEERFVILYERPKARKLSVLLDNTKGELSSAFLCKHIIAPITSAIAQLSEIGITHGFIHPNNIYYGDMPVLGDFITEPCGYSQTYYFETLERMQAAPAGKGEATSATDYYALGVLMLYILLGKEHFSTMSRETLSNVILKAGVYNALIRNRDIPEFFFDFFRGVLGQTSSDRWGEKHIKTWLTGKRYNVFLPPAPAEALRPYDIGDLQISSRRELANVLYENWDLIPELVKDGHLSHWVSISLRNKELFDNVNRLSQTILDVSVKNEMQLNEQKMYLILAFDPNGPIRIADLSFHLDGIGSLCAELYTQKADKSLAILTKFIEFNMANYWHELHRGKDYVMPESLRLTLMRIDKIRTFIRNTGYGFGIERMLYELNPTMPCQSPLLAGYYVNSLPALLSALDQLSHHISRTHDPIDRHIAAFIASKLNIQHEMRMLELEDISAIATNTAVIALKFIAMAQNRAGNQKYPGLANWLALRTFPALDHIKSRSLRTKIKSMLPDIGNLGYSQRLSDVIISSGYAAIDTGGFQQAKATYKQNAKNIISYRTQEHINHHSGILANVISQSISYATLLAILWSIIRYG